MPIALPPQAALDAFLSPTTRHTRRVEIYESDGVTRWPKDTRARLVDGSVSVDYSRDERRTLDLTLENEDGVLVNAPGEFWYDKIIKVFRGANVNEAQRLPRVGVITGDSSEPREEFRDALSATGYGDITLAYGATTLADLAEFDIIAHLRTTNGYLSHSLTDTAISGADTNQYTFADMDIGDPALDREILVVFHGRSGTSADLSSLTIGGVAATIDIQGTASGNNVAFARVSMPTGTTATVVCNTVNNLVRAGIAVHRITGGALSVVDSASAASNTVTVSGEAGTISIFGAYAYDPGAISATWTVATELYDVAMEAGVQTGAMARSTASESVTPVITYSAGPQFPVITGVTYGISQPSDASQVALIESAYNAGMRVLTLGAGTVARYGTDLFGAGTTDASPITVTTSSPAVAPETGVGHYLSSGWASYLYDFLLANQSIVLPTGVTSTDWTRISGDGTKPYVSAFQNSSARWFMYHLDPTPGLFSKAEFINLLRKAMDWLNPVTRVVHWETQVGEFMVDRISESHFPHVVKVTGRDYAKKCMLSKFPHATQFDTGIALESIIAAIAGAAGITKRALPTTGIAVGRKFFFERGVTRWQAMKEIANAYNYEIFFDAAGYLVIRPYLDPSSSVPSIYLHAETGDGRNLISYTKSTSDARLYNSVLVVGESSDVSVAPVYATAVNNDASSPTSIQNIGERLYQYNSSFIQTTQQAQDVADAFLAIHDLEEYELRFETLMLPWLEAGDILGFIDPSPAPGDPTTFLLADLVISLRLQPMSGTGKRVVQVE